MTAMAMGAPNLGSVEITEKQKTLEKTTNDSVQSGLNFGTLGAMNEIIHNLKQQSFEGKKTCNHRYWWIYFNILQL